MVNSTYRRRNNFNRTWLKIDPPPRQPRQVADKSKVLHVQNEYFEAQAVWRRRANVWTCTRAAPIIRWMIGMDRLAVKVELLKRGCHWEWS